jgi:hypothetical protein
MNNHVAISHVSIELGISRTAVYNWIKKLSIAKSRIGRISYVTIEDMERIREARVKTKIEDWTQQPDNQYDNQPVNPDNQPDNQPVSPEVDALQARIDSLEIDKQNLENRLTESSERESKSADRESELIAQKGIDQEQMGIDRDTIRGLVGKNAELSDEKAQLQLLIAAPDSPAGPVVDITPKKIKKPKTTKAKKPKKKRK